MPVLSRLLIFSSATLPAPTSRPGRPSSFRKIGSKLMVSSVGNGVGHAAGGQIAFHRRENFSGKMGAEFVVGMAGKPGAKIFFASASRQILAQQALDGFGNERRGQR